ncbi:MAG: NAD(+) synthase [Desulfarculales bacterium]|jgi:NAD+ synthetase|nr:NAD(+) synthase [Desulfarculales bacterium]
MSLFLAQINPALGDFRGNIRKMIRIAEPAPPDSTVAYALGAVSGYLRYRPDPGFLAQSERALQELAAALPQLNLITAFWDKDFQHAIFVSAKGQIKIYPAASAEFSLPQTVQAGLGLPEGKVAADYYICLSPRQFLPFEAAPPVFKPQDYTLGLVNLAGAQDTWLYAGRSQWIKEDGRVLQAAGWHEDLLALNKGDLAREPDFMADLTQGLITGISDYAAKNGFKTASLGISGGIDSAVTAVLATRALGKDNIYALTMPSRYSSQGTQDDALILADRLGIYLDVTPIGAIVASFNETLAPLLGNAPPGVEQENIQARVRAVLLMTLCNRFNHLLLATSNRSEALAGYATLYGDMTGGLAPVASLYKKEIYQLAQYLNKDEEIIPQSIIERAPSAELRPDQTDQDTLPPYPVLDAILEGIHQQGLTLEQLAEQGYSQDVLNSVVRLMSISQYKRVQAPPEIPLRRPGLSLPLTGRRNFFPLA